MVAMGGSDSALLYPPVEGGAQAPRRLKPAPRSCTLMWGTLGCGVRIAKRARRDLRQMPHHVLDKFAVWVEIGEDGAVEFASVEEVNKHEY